MTAVSTMLNDCQEIPFYPQEADYKYEMAIVYETEELNRVGFKASDLSATLKVFLDHVGSNSLNLATQDLPISHDHSPYLIHNATQNMEMTELYYKATHFCGCSQWEKSEESFLAGIELYERAFSLLTSSCSLQDLPLKLAVLMLQVVPKLALATWLQRLMPNSTVLARTLSLLQKVVSANVLRSYQDLMRSWDPRGQRTSS